MNSYLNLKSHIPNNILNIMGGGQILFCDTNKSSKINIINFDYDEYTEDLFTGYSHL